MQNSKRRAVKIWVYAGSSSKPISECEATQRPPVILLWRRCLLVAPIFLLCLLGCETTTTENNSPGSWSRLTVNNISVDWRNYNGLLRGSVDLLNPNSFDILVTGVAVSDNNEDERLVYLGPYQVGAFHDRLIHAGAIITLGAGGDDPDNGHTAHILLADVRVAPEPTPAPASTASLP
jgi:hypothetical protein